jgi:hypothetical protein
LPATHASATTDVVAAAAAKAEAINDMAFDRLIPPISHPISTWAKRIEVILQIRGIDMNDVNVGKRLGVFIIIKLPSYLATVAQSYEKLKELLDFLQSIDSRPKDESLKKVLHRIISHPSHIKLL